MVDYIVDMYLTNWTLIVWGVFFLALVLLFGSDMERASLPPHHPLCVSTPRPNPRQLSVHMLITSVS